MRLRGSIAMALSAAILLSVAGSGRFANAGGTNEKKTTEVCPIEEDEIFVTACGSGERKQTQKKKQGMEWNLQTIKAKPIKTKEKGTGKIKVAVIDSGVDDCNDIQLADFINLVPGEEEVTPLFWDVTGHGTSVAGIIAAQDNGEGITGIAPDVELYVAKIFDDNNQAPVSRVIQGIYWAIEKKVNIINMSFGTEKDSPALHKAIRDAYAAGILLVGAAGKKGKVEYPAAYEEVMAVGAVDTLGKASENSAAGEQLELVAPGEQIRSTGVFDGVMVSGGTSMAVPHVTGVAARLWAKDRQVSSEFIRQLLDASANACGEKSRYGYGMLDFSYAEKIYDEFKANYKEGKSLRKNEQKIEENTSEIPDFENVDYVEGRWFEKGHEELINGVKFTSMELATLKTGVIYPDRKPSVFYGWIANPEWHGSEKVNYISAYLFATRMATALGQGKSAGVAAVPKGFSAVAKRMVADVNTLNWNSLLATPTGHYKRLFVWGMAIHTASDAFAHSTYRKKNGKMTLIEHSKSKNRKKDKNDADNTRNVPERYQTAKAIAKASLRRCASGKNAVGSIHDFNPTKGYVNAGKTWWIGKLKTHMSVFDAALAKKLQKFSYEGGK